MNAKISNTDIAIGAYLDARMKDKHLTQMDIAKAIGRKAQSYVSDRLTGKKSFLISELDIIAPMVGFPCPHSRFGRPQASRIVLD